MATVTTAVTLTSVTSVSAHGHAFAPTLYLLILPVIFLLLFFASPPGPFVTRSRCSGPCAYWFLHILPLEVLHSYRPPSPLHLHDYGQISVRPRSQQQQLRNKAGQKARPAYRQEFLGVYFPGPVSWLFFRWLAWWNFDAKMLELNMTEAHFLSIPKWNHGYVLVFVMHECFDALSWKCELMKYLYLKEGLARGWKGNERKLPFQASQLL